MKKLLILSLALGFLFSGSVFAGTALDLKDETTRISYSLGYQIGGDFKNQGVGLDSNAVVQGIEDAMAASTPKLTQQEMTDLLVSLKEKVIAVQRARTFESTKEFLAVNLKKEGVKELPDGSQYRIIQAGSGASPKVADTVDIHFATSRTDGTMITTTHSETNTPRTYQVSKMLPALQQALLKMAPGAKWEVFVAPAGRTELMEGGGVLVYELELLAIHPPAKKVN